jgi:hypothetical protein
MPLREWREVSSLPTASPCDGANCKWSVRLANGDVVLENGTTETVAKPISVKHTGFGTEATIGRHRVVAYGAGEWGGVLQIDDNGREPKILDSGRFVGIIGQGQHGWALKTWVGPHGSELLHLEAGIDTVSIVSRERFDGYAYVLVGTADRVWIAGDLGLWKSVPGSAPQLVYRAKWPFIVSGALTPAGEIILAARWSAIKVSTANDAFSETWWVPADCK